MSRLPGAASTSLPVGERTDARLVSCEKDRLIGLRSSNNTNDRAESRFETQKLLFANPMEEFAKLERRKRFGDGMGCRYPSSMMEPGAVPRWGEKIPEVFIVRLTGVMLRGPVIESRECGRIEIGIWDCMDVTKPFARI